jgi:hypothetical protein
MKYFLIVLVFFLLFSCAQNDKQIVNVIYNKKSNQQLTIITMNCVKKGWLQN